MAVFHVCEILVGKEFAQHGRAGRSAGFPVAAVPDEPPVPFGLETVTYVVHDLALDEVRKFPAGLSVFTGRKFPPVFGFQGVNGERADDRVLLHGACIRVEGESQVERYVPAFFVRIHVRTAAHIRYPVAPAHEIVLVVAFLFILAEKGGVRSRPLEPVSGTFCKTRHSGYFRN